MSLHSQLETPSAAQSRVDKGKRRAIDPTETSPLLHSSQRSYSTPPEAPHHDSPSSTHLTPRLRTKLISVFLLSLLSCLIFFTFLAFLIWSYASKASGISVDDVIQDGLTIQGPNRVDIINATEGGVWLNVSYNIGVDAGALIGLNTNEVGESFFESAWKAIGRWGVRSLDRVSVNLSTIHVESFNPPARLVTAEIPPTTVQLTTNPPDDFSWLTPASTPVFVSLAANATVVMEFLRTCWRQGFIETHLTIDRARMHGGAVFESSWRDMLTREMRSIDTAIRFKIPFLPGWPKPGHDVPLPSVSEILSLISFSVTTEEHALTLDATASLRNPVPPSIDFASPVLPFTVSLPALSPPLDVASVYSAPFTSTHPNITLNISGSVLPLPNGASLVLSTFCNRYLSGQPNDIVLTTPLLPGYQVETEFPAPRPRPQVLRNVTIHGMKVRASGGGMVASGTVFARLVLPKGMNLGLDIYKVLPDVLVFDGEVPSSIPELKDRHNLPDPLPEHAFGHIMPDDWIPSLSVADDPPEGGEGSSYIVSAKIVDVPLEVLPGRQKEFSSFIGKVLFGSGALAGLMGNAGIGVNIQGLPIHAPDRAGDLELRELPFRGSVRIGRKD